MHPDSGDRDDRPIRPDFLTGWLAAGNTKETLLELVKSQKPYQNHIDWLNSRHAAAMIGGKFVIINETKDFVFDCSTVTFSSVQDLRNLYANKKIPNPRTGKGQPKKISIFTDWMNSSNRRSYDGIVFAPGKKIPGVYNLWTGFGIEPIAGNVDP